MERANTLLASKFGKQDFDQREEINLQEKIAFTVLFSGIFATLGFGVYFLVTWAYQLINNLI